MTKKQFDNIVSNPKLPLNMRKKIKGMAKIYGYKGLRLVYGIGEIPVAISYPQSMKYLK